MKSKKKKRKITIKDIIRLIVLLVAFSVLLYPTFSSYLNEKNGSKVVSYYDEESVKLSKAEKEQMLEDARAYNQEMLGNIDLIDPFSQEDTEIDARYESLLNVDGSGMMGYIRIPKINIELPIYHGTSEAVRAIIVFPWATSLIIQAGVWKFIIDKDYGALNTLLMKIGLISSPVNWTPTPGAYFAWEIFVGIFVTVPFVTFCVLSGLQSIDNSYYEAATVDGANYWQKLFKITLPLVKSSLTVSTVLNIIYVFNSFPIIWTITKGDPASRTDTLVTYLYKLAFYKGKSGEAAAVSVIGFLILCICASVYMVLSLRKEDED